MVSWFHYLNHPKFYEYNRKVEDMRCSSFTDFLRRPVNDFLRYGFSVNGDFENVVDRWADHVSGWLSQENVCAVRYEDLKSNPRFVIDRIGEYLGRNSREDLKLVSVEKSKSILPRKGIAGDWVNLCNQSDLEFMEARVGAYGLNWRKMTGGYDAPE
jgi:hypothetical protein